MKNSDIIDTNIYVLKNDYTYDVIKSNTDLSILHEVKDRNNKYIVFPINSSTGVKYYLENVSSVPHEVKVSINGKLSFLSYGPDTVDMTDEVNISMKSKTIAEYYALLGSLLNIYMCSTLTDTVTSEYEIRPAFMDFEIRILVDGDNFLLTPDIYSKTVPIDEYSVLNQIDTTVILIEDLVTYMSRAVSNKNGFENVTDKYRSFILFDNNTYARANMAISPNSYLLKSPLLNDTKKSKIDKMNETAVILLDTDSPLYATLPYIEFDMLRSDQAYHLSWIAYEYEINSSLNTIADEDLDVNIIKELEGSDYCEIWSDDMMYYHMNQALFAMLSMQDISCIIKQTLLHRMDEPWNICYTWTIKKSYDKLHQCMISDSLTDTMINRDHKDILRLLMKDIRTTFLSNKVYMK